MSIVRRTPTEACPLTKENNTKCLNNDHCGFKTIIGIFIVLTAAVTISLILQLIYYDGLTQPYVDHHGAVATDNRNCSLIGIKILQKGGNSVDAAIAAALCTTVLLPHKTGLGGGGYILIQNPKYANNPILIDFAKNTVKGEFNQAKIRIPSVLKGFEFTHSLYGKLPWKDLIEPTVTLITQENGFSHEQLFQSPKNHFFSKKIKNLEDFIKLPILAKTLDLVALKGTTALYNSTKLSKLENTNSSLWNDLFQEDLMNYEPNETKVLGSSLFYNYHIFYPQHATLLKSFIDKINNLNISLDNASSVESQTQSINVLVGLNKDNQFLDEEGQYTSVTAIDEKNTLVCILSGMSNPLNEQFMTSAGFVLDIVLHNDYLNSLVPVFFYNNPSVCGTAGIFGSDDQMLNSQLLYKLIARSLNITQAVESSRYYVHQDGIAIENDDMHTDDAALRLHLKSLFQLYSADITTIMKSVNIVITRYNLISSHSDSRGEDFCWFARHCKEPIILDIGYFFKVADFHSSSCQTTMPFCTPKLVLIR